MKVTLICGYKHTYLDSVKTHIGLENDISRVPSRVYDLSSKGYLAGFIIPGINSLPLRVSPAKHMLLTPKKKVPVLNHSWHIDGQVIVVQGFSTCLPLPDTM